MMKSSSWPIIRRILWPERASLFAIVGGAIGLMGDITGFFSEFISPTILTVLFGIIAAIASLLCLQRAFLTKAEDDKAVEEVVNCRVCDAMRFSLFAFAAFLVLLAIGQDKSATEVIASKLGLIHEDVKQIGSDVGEIKSGVSDLQSATQSQQIVKNPKTAEDFYKNAWIYSYIQRDPAKAHQSLLDLYKNNGGKLDSAEFYFETGRQILGKNELLQNMERLAVEHNDPALLVVAARHAPDLATGNAWVEKARAMDPQYPFAYWDMQRMAALSTQMGTTPADQLSYMKEQIADSEKFLSLIGNKPASHYFFLPQYQPDHETFARQNLASMQRSAESLEHSLKRLDDALRKQEEVHQKIRGQ